MDTTHLTNPADRTDSTARQEPEEALRAFAQLLARLAADRSVSDAMEPGTSRDETVPAAAGPTTAVE